MHKSILGLALAAVTATACDQATGTARTPMETAAAKPPLFGEKTFTILYGSGDGSGVSKAEYVRDWGHQRAEVYEGPSTRVRVVYADGRAWAIHPQTGQAFEREDQVTATFIAHINDDPGSSFGRRRMLIGMGAQPTGETGAFAGHACEYYEATVPEPSGSVRVCVADWGGLLYLKLIGPGEIEQVATAVRLGDGGPDAAFELDKAGAQHLPPRLPAS